LYRHDVQFEEVLDGDEQEDTSSADPNRRPGHIAVATAPALAKNPKKSPSDSSAAASSIGSIPAAPEAPKTDQQDSKPGPAWKTVGGTVKNIEGEIYTVEDYEGNQVKLHVGQGTKHIHKKNVGDTVRT